MRLLVDVDDTAVNLVGPWLDDYNADYNDRLRRENILSWCIMDYVKPEAREAIMEYPKNPEIYRRAEPTTGVVAALSLLRARGHEIVFASHSLPEVYGRKQPILEMYGIMVAGDVYHDTQDKTQIDADVLIDDRAETVDKWLDANHTGGVVFACPWNKQWAARGCRSVRTGNWYRIVRFIDTLCT